MLHSSVDFVTNITALLGGRRMMSKENRRLNLLWLARNSHRLRQCPKRFFERRIRVPLISSSPTRGSSKIKRVYSARLHKVWHFSPWLGIVPNHFRPSSLGGRMEEGDGGTIINDPLENPSRVCGPSPLCCYFTSRLNTNFSSPRALPFRER